MRYLLPLLLWSLLGSTHAFARSLVVYCSHDPDACELAARTFQRETGIETAIIRKATGEFYAQIRAERANPRADVWYGGTIDPFLQAAAEGLFVAYRSPGVADLQPWARGEVGVGVTFVHEFITQQLAGFEVAIAIPCEGTGDALGGMAIINGAPHPDEARIFYDWALTKPAQELANRTRNLLVPAHARAEIRAEAAAFANVKTLDVDPAKFGDPELRKRLLARWQKEIGDSLR